MIIITVHIFTGRDNCRYPWYGQNKIDFVNRWLKNPQSGKRRSAREIKCLNTVKRGMMMYFIGITFTHLPIFSKTVGPKRHSKDLIKWTI